MYLGNVGGGMGRAAMAGFSPGPTECCLFTLWIPATGWPGVAAADVKPYDPDEVRTGFVAGNGGGPPLGVVAALLLLLVVALLIISFIHVEICTYRT